MRSADQRARRRGPSPELPEEVDGAVDAAPFSAWAQARLGNGLVQASLRGEETELGGFVASRMLGEAAGLGGGGGTPDNSAVLALLRAAQGDREPDHASARASVERSSGSALPPAVAARMGAALGHDVSHVTVHTDGAWDPLESTCRHASLSIL